MRNDEIKARLLTFHFPRWDELPNFDIYMDQVVFYINDHLGVLNIAETDKEITASMVNNYVKNSIVKAPIRKHYKNYHLAFLIIVTILKRAYSLNEISKMINIQRMMKNNDLQLAYDTFATYFETVLHETVKNGYYLSKESDPYRRLLLNITQSVVLKIYAQIELKNPIFDKEKDIVKEG